MTSAVQLGPYQFSAEDVRATLRHHDDLFRMLVDDIDPDLAAGVEPYRVEAARAVEADAESTALRVLWDQLRGAGRFLRGSGAFGADHRGTVTQLNLSSGGVPKQPVERTPVGFDGVAGDRQATRRHHGRPWQALCLWSSEVIEELAAAGHPIFAGAAGENVTVAGLPWERVRPGVVLRVGSVTCEIQAFALPCAQNARWFSDGDFNAMHHRRGPVSRVYATVLEPGGVTVGDDVELRCTVA